MKTNNTKKTLVASLHILSLCLTSFIGTTFAWFTDSVTSSGNVIKTGTLDVEMYWADGAQDVPANMADWNDASKGAMYSNFLWEPGYTEAKHIMIANLGTLALKYELVIIPNGDVTELADVIDVYYYADGAEKIDGRDDLDATKKLGSLAELIANGIRTDHLEGKTNHTITLVLKMQDEAGNEYQDMTVSGGFTVQLLATQYTSEKDSFGSDYDKDATYPEVAVGGLTKAEDTAANLTTKDGSVILGIPADAEAGNYNIVVSDKKVETDAEGKTTVSMDIALKLDGVKVENNSTVYTVTVNVGAGEKLIDKVLHNNEVITNFTYNPATGNVTFETTHFSPFAIVYDVVEEVEALENEGNTYYINNYADLVFFRNSVNAGTTYSGKTVVLTADIDLQNTAWAPIGTASKIFYGTFDGQNHTISNLVINGGSGSDIGFFGVTHNGEIKNLTINNAKVSGRLNVAVVAGQPYTSKYTNITVTGHVEVNGLAYVGAVGGKNAYADWTDITVNADETSYVKAYSMENGKAYRTYVGGVVGFNGEGAHTFKNITSNIDVYGSTIDVGGAFGIAHYNNKFENVTVTGNVYITDAAEAADAREIGGIAGVWHNENGTSVTFTGCEFKGTLNSNIEGLDLSAYTIAGAPYGKGTGKLIIDGKTTTLVTTAEALTAALAAGYDVVFGADITVAATEGGYNVAGITVKGQTIDGNGYTLSATGAWGTWDCAIYITGGTIKNLTVANAMRGIFSAGSSSDIYLENVDFKNVIYTFNSDDGNGQYGVYATNCTFNGWTSFSNCHKEVVFTDCTFSEGYGYAFCRPYNTVTKFVNCTFAEGYALDTAYVAGMVFEGCYYGETAITAENATTLGDGEELFFYNGLNGAVIK